MTEDRENKVVFVESADAVDGSQFRPIVVDLTVLYPIIDPNKAGTVAPIDAYATNAPNIFYMPPPTECCIPDLHSVEEGRP